MASAAQQAQAPISLLTASGVCDLSKRTYFHQTVSANTTFTFVNAPDDVKVFEIEINHTGGALTFPANVRWSNGVAPSSLTTGKIHLFYFRRTQSTGADQWIGSFLMNC